jgi:hypothetical protein
MQVHPATHHAWCPVTTYELLALGCLSTAPSKFPKSPYCQSPCAPMVQIETNNERTHKYHHDHISHEADAASKSEVT